MGQGGTEAYQRLQQLADPDAASSSMSVQGRSDLARRAFDLVRPEFAAPVVRAFEMIVFEDCTASDAACRVGMTADAVRQAKCRILRRLREVLGDSE
jgi:DNA-directed RNA polymerase specialized sigma24 family protein